MVKRKIERERIPSKIIFNVVSDKNLKKSNKKPIKEVMFGTRNKIVVLFSKIFGIKKTNEIIEKHLSSNQVISKILDAEKHGFEIRFNVEDEEEKYSIERSPVLLKDEKEGWAVLLKEIRNPNMDPWEYDDKYWNTVRDNLLLYYDEESTEAILEHYNYNVPSEKDRIIFVSICGISEDKEDAPNEGIYIEAHLNGILNHSKIEKRYNNKIIKYDINGEEILSVLVDSLIQVFG